jgi:putative ABC transport system permease protein
MKLLAARLASEHPQTYRDWTLRADVLNRTFNSLQPGPIMIQIAAIFVLLIACANMATLLLARSAARRREMAIRAALGAGRARLLRQLLTEGLLLASVAGVLALAVADWTARFVSSLSDSGLLDMTTDWRVMAFTAAATLGTAVGFALLPALRTSKIGAERSPSSSGHSARLRSVLVAGETGLSMVLFVAAGLMLRSWLALIALNPGFNPHHLLVTRVPLNEKRYRNDEQRTRFLREAMEKVRAIPGAMSVAAVNWPPLWGGERASLQQERTAPSPAGPEIRYRAVTAGYFHLLGVQMMRGRDFHDGDADGHIAIVDAAMAHSVWPNEDPIGKRVRVWRNGVEGPWLEIVGVAPAMANSFIRNLTQPQIFELNRSPSAAPWLLIRTAGNPGSLATAARDAVFAVDRDQPLAAMQSMDDMLDLQAGEWKLSAQLFGGLAALAMLLSSIGTYGILAYSLTQRRREIGIRMALGARPRDVVNLIARQGLVLALGGVATGIVLSLGLMRFLANFVYGVTMTDPKTYAAGIGFLLSRAALAAIVPARRAARVDPATTLRQE